eukprot:353578-Chlamydomonas_euryale.AAC.10
MEQRVLVRRFNRRLKQLLELRSYVGICHEPHFDVAGCYAVGRELGCTTFRGPPQLRSSSSH